MELSNICDYKNDRVSADTLSVENYISTENMLPNKGGVCDSSNLPLQGNVIRFCEGDVLVSNIRPYFKKIWLADKQGGCSADVLCIKAKANVDTKFLYYLLSQQDFFDYVMAGCKGCKMPRGDKQHIMQWDIHIPQNLNEQRSIANLLSALDDKIELNKRINDNLEQFKQITFLLFMQIIRMLFVCASICCVTIVERLCFAAKKAKKEEKRRIKEIRLIGRKAQMFCTYKSTFAFAA